MSTVPVAAEVESLHQFIQRWFNGSVPKTPESFSRLSTSWPEGFTLIDPHNKRHSSAELLESTYKLHAKFPSLSIEIRNMSISHRSPGTSVATYEEWHLDPDGIEARLCSATFAFNGACPDQLHWIHIHESMLAV